jgi:acetyl esterase/lipase
MAFDNLRPQPPRTPENTRVPGLAIAYGEEALARSRAAAELLSPTMDIAFGPHPDQSLDIYRSENDGLAPVMVFFHGGAWAHGYKEWNGFMAPALVDLPAVFVSVGYRLAPEHKWPAPFDDALSALSWVHANIATHGGDPARIHVAGWSAGGTLAALLVVRSDLYAARDLPVDVVQSCLVTSTSFQFRNSDLAPGTRGITYRDFLFETDEDEKAASVIDQVRGHLPPFLIAQGENDFAHVSKTGERIVPLLEATGTSVERRIYPGLDHYAMNLAQGDPNHDWVQAARARLASS